MDLTTAINSDNLNYLDLSNKNISTIPDITKYGDSSFIETLNLSNNLITELNLEKVKGELKELILINNNIKKVYGKTKLLKLDLSHNYIESVNIESETLEVLKLSSNCLFELDCSKLPKLRELYVEHNNLTKVPKIINLKNILSVNISDNIINELSNLPLSITNINASNNKIDNILISNDNRLKILNLSYNCLKKFNTQLSDKLMFIDVSYNKLTKFKIPNYAKVVKVAYNKIIDIIDSETTPIMLDISNNLIHKQPKIKQVSKLVADGNPYIKVFQEQVRLREQYKQNYGSIIPSAPQMPIVPPPYQQITNPLESCSISTRTMDQKTMFHQRNRMHSSNPNYIVFDRSIIIDL